MLTLVSIMPFSASVLIGLRGAMIQSLSWSRAVLLASR